MIIFFIGDYFKGSTIDLHVDYLYWPIIQLNKTDNLRRKYPGAAGGGSQL